ncbi:MAG TPA: metallophosphoesterase family protein [Solirubrobacterales bacterium]|nr:metallophosphoesterase family protein [Solirubrobacterales bacterium]
MKLLAFSDLHCDLVQAARLVETAAEADAVVAVGDLASIHSGLEETVAALRPIDRPIVLVPGNNETDVALREACAGWESATVLHGEATRIGTTTIFGLGGGVPVTPWDWSFDLTEQEAERLLARCPEEAVLAVHSPPFGHVDLSRGRHLGSRAVLAAIEAKRPPLALCGHIHEGWGGESAIGPTRVVNVGPRGLLVGV